jgi:hypothetical protein
MWLVQEILFLTAANIDKCTVEQIVDPEELVSVLTPAGDQRFSDVIQ